MILHGRVKNGVVVFQSGPAAPLPDGTLVEVTPFLYDHHAGLLMRQGLANRGRGFAR